MKKAFAFGMICIVLLGFWVWKQSKPGMIVVLPEKSVFFIDQNLSTIFRNSIENSIQKAYQVSRNSHEVMDQATAKFPEISSMKVQICQSDKICFYVNAAEPIFLLNHEFVVCDKGTKVVSSHFSDDVIKNLVQVIGTKSENLQMMVDFVIALPEKFKQEFVLEWGSETDILLLPKDGKNCILQCNTESVPSLRDLTLCQSIGQAATNKSKTNKKRVMYDVRFKNQIIVR